MSKNLIFNTAKQAIIDLANKLEYHNLDVFSNQTAVYLDMMRLSGYLDVAASAPTSEIEIAKDQPAKPESIQELIDEDNHIYIGSVHLLLLGGEIGSRKIFLSEKAQRDFDCQEGDWIKATLVNCWKFPNGLEKRFYDYEIVQRSPEILPTKRRLIKYAIVNFEPTIHALYIDAPSINGLNHRVILNNYNMGSLKVRQGDVIDYAYWENDLTGGKVIWNHQTEAEITRQVKPMVKRNPVAETKETKSREFAGFKIIAFGYESKKSQFNKVVENYEGTFTYLTGEERDSLIRKEILSADLVVVFQNFVSHSCMWQVKNICKSGNINLVFLDKRGMASFFTTVRNNLRPVNSELIIE